MKYFSRKNEKMLLEKGFFKIIWTGNSKTFQLDIHNIVVVSLNQKSVGHIYINPERNYREDEKNEYLYDIKKDPLQNKNIAEENPELNQKMFKMILKDADGELIDHSTSLMKKIEEWYKMEP